MHDWRPASNAAVAARRAALLQRARDYFAAEEVLAVDTPSLSDYATVDLNIDPIPLRLSAGQTAYLHTSPEFCMKRLLAAGYPDIYTICRVFRNNEVGDRHATEFTMIEWYRLNFGMSDIINDTCSLIAACLERPALRAAVVREYADVLLEVVGLDIFSVSSEALAAALDADDTLRHAIGDDVDAWLDLAIGTRVAPGFPGDRLTVLRHYPASQAALARLCPRDVRTADRFEVFLGSMELANGYVELTDAAEQERRFAADNARRVTLGKDMLPADETLLQALQHGLPDCAGVALGVERLHMLYEQTDKIDDVVTFSPEISS